MSKEIKLRMKYEKPQAQDLHDLTPVAGFCSTGFTDGGCGYGNFAGGVEGCVNGNFATPPTGCVNGDHTWTICTTGGSVQ